MRCTKCKKNYKNTLVKCPNCGEVNHKMLEDKTIAISEISEDLSLTGLINNQIEEFNEEIKEEKEIKKTKKRQQKKNKKEAKFGSKKDIKIRKRIFGIVGAFMLLILVCCVGIVFYYERKHTTGYDYVYELNLTFNDYENIEKSTVFFDVLVYVNKDEYKIKVMNQNVIDNLNMWVSLYKSSQYNSVEEFDEVTEKLKDKIDYINNVEYDDLKLIDYDNYEKIIKEVNDYYIDNKIYYEGLSYYNKRYYNKAYGILDNIDKDNKFKDKANIVNEKIVNEVLELLKNNIDQIKNEINDNTDDSTLLDMYTEIENVIIEYNNIYSNLNLSNNSDYQVLLSEYKAKVLEYSDKL